MKNELLAQRLLSNPYEAYSYSYPHKSAYRALQPAIDLRELWAQEDRSALFLYIHVPFCSMRCGFCNLFTLARPQDDLLERYLQQMIRQMRMTREVLGEYRFASFACGGGTPSFMQAEQLERLFFATHDFLGADLKSIPSGIEVSPDTATIDRLAICRAAGIDRVSMGVQSFFTPETAALVRKQTNAGVVEAIERIRALDFPILNLDLIYGIAGQTVHSFIESVRIALSYQPEELYLYPLYVRPLTGLGRISPDKARIPVLLEQTQDNRPDMYRAARDLLRESGYEQVSMRMFRRPRHNMPALEQTYSCQNDGMVGIGCGARSYTRSLHYSEEYGVARSRVVDILNEYCRRDENDFLQARYGFQLDEAERKRRFVIQSLLVWPGVSYADYSMRFGSHCMDDLPQLHELLELGLADEHETGLSLNDKGMSRADVIGPWLISEQVAQRSTEYALT